MTDADISLNYRVINLQGVQPDSSVYNAAMPTYWQEILANYVLGLIHACYGGENALHVEKIPEKNIIGVLESIFPAVTLETPHGVIKVTAGSIDVTGG